jgi:hypothetical protein
MTNPGMSGAPRDVTPLPDLVHGLSRAGPIRQHRPVYVDLLPPCNAGCPAGEKIQAWLSYLQAGDPERAWRQLVADNTLASIHGRVCYHPCERVCNRAQLDSAVSIHAVERFLGDRARVAVRARCRERRPTGPTARRPRGSRQAGGRQSESRCGSRRALRCTGDTAVRHRAGRSPPSGETRRLVTHEIPGTGLDRTAPG